MVNVKILIMLFLLTLGRYAYSQSLDSLEDIRNYALSNSVSYKRTLLDLEKAGNDLDPLLRLDETALTLASDHSGNETVDHDITNSISLTVPVIDQISLDASLDDDSAGSLGFTFAPMVHSDQRGQLEILYGKALQLSLETRTLVENEALEGILGWISAREQLVLDEADAEVQSTLYRDEKIRYEAGESDLDEAREALADWTESRSRLLLSRDTLKKQEQILLDSLGADIDFSSIGTIDPEDLEEELSRLKETLNPAEALSADRYAVKSAYLNVSSAEESLKDTWIFDPTLNLTGRLNYPDIQDSSLEPSWTAGIELTLSYQDFKGQERAENQAELEQARLEATQTSRESELALEQILLSLERTEESKSLAVIRMEQAAELYEEAMFLLNLGEYSQAETESLRLEAAQAEADYFTSLSEEYLAWRELMLYL